MHPEEVLVLLEQMLYVGHVYSQVRHDVSETLTYAKESLTSFTFMQSSNFSMASPGSAWWTYNL